MATFVALLARMAELVDARDSNSRSFGVWVRFPLRVQTKPSESWALLFQGFRELGCSFGA
jgi:hypothetical protein